MPPFCEKCRRWWVWCGLVKAYKCPLCGNYRKVK